MPETEMVRTRFEHANPILNVANLTRSVRYYVDILGFTNAEWGGDDFTCVTRDGASIYLSEGDQGQPGTWVWLGVEDVEALHDEYRLLPPNRLRPPRPRCLGQAAGRRRYTNSSLWADDLAAVIQTHNLQRPVLVGWSYGGYVIADYVRKFGDAGLGGLVFVGVSTKNGTSDAASFLTDDVLAIFGDVLSADVRASMNGSRALAALFARDRSDEWEIAFGSAMMVPPQIRIAMFSRLLDNDDVLASIRVPTLVVHGRNDRVVKVSAAQRTAKMVPGATLLVYPGVGHAPHLEIATRFNRDLAEFVRSIR